MARHTRKYKEESWYTNDYDITLYSSGGETFTVIIFSYDTDTEEKKTFTGLAAVKRAVAYATEKFEQFKQEGK